MDGYNPTEQSQAPPNSVQDKVLVYNKAEQSPDYVSAEETKDTSKYEPLSNQQIRMANPDGTTHHVIGHSFKDALDAGWQYLPKTNEETQAEEHTKLIDKKANDISNLEVGANKFGNEVLFGVPRIVQDATRTPEEKEAYEKAEKRFEGQHELLSPALSGAGFLASLAIPGVGELGDLAGHAAERAILGGAEEATAGLSRKVIASAAKSAATAEVYGAPSQVANLAVGNKEQAAEGLVASLGVGSVIGVGSGLIGAGIDKMSSEFPKLSSTVENFADDMAIKQAGVNPDKLKPFQKSNLLNLLNKEGKYGDVVGEDFANEMKDKYGKAIGEHRDFLDSKLGELNDPTNLNHDGIITEPKYGVVPSTIANDIGAKLKEQFPMYGVPGYEAATKALDDAVSQIRMHGEEPLGFGKDSQKISDILNGNFGGKPTTNYIVPDQMSAVANEVRKSAASMFSDSRDEAMTRAYTSLEGNADKMADYTNAKGMYGAAKTMLTDKLEAPPVRLGNYFKAGVLGSALHPVLGPAAYPAAHYIGRPLLGEIAKRGVFPFAIPALKKIAANSPNLFGSMLAKAAEDGVNSHLSTIQGMILNAAKKAPYRAIDPITSFLGDHSNGLSKDKQFEKVGVTLASAVSNPASIADKVGGLQSLFGLTPELQQLVNDKNLAAINYLHSQYPKDPNANKPFAKDNNWQPTSQQKADFKSILAVVENPMIAAHKMVEGTLTTREVDALKTVYPAIHAGMVKATTQAAYAPGADKVPMKTRSKAMTLTGQSSMSSPDFSNIQNMYASRAQGSNGNSAQPQPKHTNELKGKGPSMQTASQRRSYGSH